MGDGVRLESAAHHGECIGATGVPAADTRICEAAGANQTLCNLVGNATCVWVSAEKQARLEFDYELERWVPILAIVLVVVCPLLCWPIWCSKHRSTLEMPIVTPAASSINGRSPAGVNTLQGANEVARTAAAYIIRPSDQVDEGVPRWVGPGNSRQQSPKRQPAARVTAPAVEPLSKVGSAVEAIQVDGDPGLGYGSHPTSPGAISATFSPSSTPVYPREATSPTNSEASSINSDDFADALEHDPD